MRSPAFLYFPNVYKNVVQSRKLIGEKKYNKSFASY